MKDGRHCSRTLTTMPTASPRCAAAGTMVMTSTMMTRPGTSAERSARASPCTGTHRQLGQWRAECATAAASSGTSRGTRSTGRIRSRWRRAAAAVGDLENRYHSDAQCRHTRRAESFGLPWILSHSDTRERGHAFTRVHAPPPTSTDTGTPPDRQPSGFAGLTIAHRGIRGHPSGVAAYGMHAWSCIPFAPRPAGRLPPCCSHPRAESSPLTRAPRSSRSSHTRARTRTSPAGRTWS